MDKFARKCIYGHIYENPALALADRKVRELQERTRNRGVVDPSVSSGLDYVIECLVMADQGYKVAMEAAVSAEMRRSTKVFG